MRLSMADELNADSQAGKLVLHVERGTVTYACLLVIAAQQSCKRCKSLFAMCMCTHIAAGLGMGAESLHAWHDRHTGLGLRADHSVPVCRTLSSAVLLGLPLNAFDLVAPHDCTSRGPFRKSWVIT